MDFVYFENISKWQIDHSHLAGVGITVDAGNVVPVKGRKFQSQK